MIFFLVGCLSETPFPGSVWEASCSTAPLPFTVSFEETVDGRGSHRSYLGHINIPLEAALDSQDTGTLETELTDYYLWQLSVDTDGHAETQWLIRAPMPAEMEEKWDLQPMDIHARSYHNKTIGLLDDVSKVRYRVGGLCTWGGEEGNFEMFYEENCSTTGASPSLSFCMGAFLLLLIRRR